MVIISSLLIFISGCEETDVGMAIDTGADAVRAATLSDEEVKREADNYGVPYLIKRGHDTRPAISALEKLATLGSGHTFLSNHPAPEALAKRMRTAEYDSHEPKGLSTAL